MNNVMRSVLWFLLILGTSVASLEESNQLDKPPSASDPQSSALALADDIYKQQIECESFIGEAVNKVLDEGTSIKFPVPDDKYVECKKSLNEKKKEYIQLALLGMDYYSTLFPMRLSNGRVVMPLVPVDKKSTEEEEEKADFDVQEELCATNQFCISVSNKMNSKYNSDKVNNELQQKFSRCRELLEELKVKYIKVNKLDENELKRARGLNVKCSQGAVTFFLPKPKKDNTDSQVSSVTPEVKTDGESVDGSLDPEKKPTQFYNPYRDPYNEVVKELSAVFKKKSQDEETNEQDLNKVTTPSGSQEERQSAQGNIELKDNDGESEANVVDVGVAETMDSKNENQNISENEVKSSDNLQDEKVTDDEEKDENTSSTKTESIPMLGDRQTSPSDGSIGNGKEKSRKTKSGQKKSQSDKNVELVSYRVNVVSKKEDGKVVQIQASGRIKKIESGNKTSNLHLKSKSNTENGLGFAGVLSQENDTKRRHPESLEDNIIMMENDCKELLQFGEQLLVHKILNSIVNFENQCNECIRKLNRLKKMYIDKQQLDVMSHKTIFPLTLPSGVQKLVWLPTQFLKTDFVEPPSTSNVKPGDIFEVDGVGIKQPENSVWKTREPFDDPAFIPNEEFLESLQERVLPAESSTLSKVASMLHINGGHPEKKVLE